ncbi:putative toxin-antitoxin system toxin component, PIN family [Azospirillum sp. YIM B02556]|uniref:Toxin-antitoxin system toxin component, PIN family n=1 Tax=Azospirillum endophyticum TaxID=2800326 RepID=A0ABS1F7L9_9PROT|nr:putative toxin-antitoxin system toxin component, PIN family [Azospirillum endophyticum]MBK1839373.1 putative toxin-antitoxin system toxin component, PIN family [Azospirillum endophyticum]
MPNVVFDASVLVSAALKPLSIPAEALRAARIADRIVLSEETLQEITAVLARPKFERVFTPAVRAAFIALLCDAADFHTPLLSVNDCRDAKDNKYLELALASSAWAIVSSDDDLLTLHPYHDVVILTPAAYLAALGSDRVKSESI